MHLLKNLPVIAVFYFKRLRSQSLDNDISFSGHQLWKENLNSDDQQFYQYQQNHNIVFNLKIQILAWGRHKNVA